MRVALLVLFAGCGRFGFSDEPHRDAIALPAIDTNVSTTYAQTVLAEHPVVYYRLDEVTSGAVVDASGNGNNGKHDLEGTAGTLTFAVAGALANDPDTALSVSGTQNAHAQGAQGTAALVSVPLTFNDVFAGDFTVEGWVRPQVPPPTWTDNFFVWETYLKNGLRIGWAPDMTPGVWTDQSGSNGNLRGTVALVAGTWVHFVVTRQGSGFTVYIDGAVVAEAAIGYKPPVIGNMTEACIGACHGLPATADYDEVAVYDHALSAQVIAQHHAAGIAQ